MDALLYLWLATGFMGAVVWPLLIFIRDSIQGQAGEWTMGVAMVFFANGLLLATIVSVAMYMIARFYLWMEWLPKRR